WPRKGSQQEQVSQRYHTALARPFTLAERFRVDTVGDGASHGRKRYIRKAYGLARSELLSANVGGRWRLRRGQGHPATIALCLTLSSLPVCGRRVRGYESAPHNRLAGQRRRAS